jgi:lipopolysaccharide export system protein LptA
MRAAVFVAAVVAWSMCTASAQTAEPPASKATAATPSDAKHPQQGGFALSSSKCQGLINVASDNFEGDFQTKIGIYTGNVVITQSECKLRADKVVAEAVSGKDINRLTATGNVVFDSSSGTATGDNGVYDLVPKTITLTGKVILTKGKDVMRGTNLIVDVNTGVAHLTAKNMPGGRVQSSFTPAQREPGAKTATKPKAGPDN